MRLATLMTSDGPRAALRKGDQYIDIGATDSSLPSTVLGLLHVGSDGLERAAQLRTRQDAFCISADNTTYLAPVPDPQKIICIGLNYRNHAEETGAPIPNEPILFSKYPSALIGHGTTIHLPPVSKEVDYEAELVIVVGKPGRNLSEAQAADHIAGYTIGHDVSARDWQLKKPGKQWMAGKTFDTFAPCGPELVTTDEIPDPHSLRIQFRLNGETMQDSNTNQMIFTGPQILAYLSQIFTLEPGDLVYTGTPPGVGFARKPPVYLRPGDVAEVEIDGLGVLRNSVA